MRLKILSGEGHALDSTDFWPKLEFRYRSPDSPGNKSHRVPADNSSGRQDDFWILDQGLGLDA